MNLGSQKGQITKELLMIVTLVVRVMSHKTEQIFRKQSLVSLTEFDLRLFKEFK